jgi:hypothetical protein
MKGKDGTFSTHLVQSPATSPGMKADTGSQACFPFMRVAVQAGGAKVLANLEYATLSVRIGANKRTCGAE